MKTVKTTFLLALTALLLTSCSNLDIQKLNKNALTLMNQGNVDGAIARLQSINDLNPNFAETHYNLGIAYHKKGIYDEAINSLNTAISLNGKFADAYYSLGVVYEDYALTSIEKINKDKNDVKNIQLIIDNLKESQKSYKKYTEIAADSPDIPNILNKIQILNDDISKYENILMHDLHSN